MDRLFIAKAFWNEIRCNCNSANYEVVAIDIWRKVENDVWKLKPVSLQDIEDVEALLSVQLPETYKKMILEQNGGTLALNAYPSPKNTDWGSFVKVEAIRGIGKENGILESDYFINEWNLPKDLILLDGDGHSWIGLDYRQKKENPPVVFIDTERDQLFELASNFDVFLNGLTSIDDTSSSYGDIEVDYDDLPSHTEEELIKEFANGDSARCIELINMMPFSCSQDFVLKSYIALIQYNDLAIREAVASGFLTIIIYDNGFSEVLYSELLDLISKDSNERIRVYAGFIKDEMENKK